MTTARGSRAAIALGAGLAILAAGGASADPDRVMATVNGVGITLGHMAVLREQLPPQYLALPDEVLFEGLLDQLIQQSALAQSYEGAGNRRDELALENDRRAYLAGAAVRAAALDAVTDVAIREAYEARFAGAEPQVEYNASHILVEEREAADSLLAEIGEGADFAELARVHSTDGAAAGGGELGWFGLGMMVPEFEEAVVSLEPGGVAGPVETRFGWHLVRLNETRIAEAPELDAVRDELAGEIEQAAIAARIAEVTGAAEVERSDEGVDPAILHDMFGG